MANKVITSTGDCSACCGGTPTGCSCALLIPPLTSPYADYATAAAAITNQTDSCLAYYDVAGGLGGLSASFDGTTLAVSGQCTDAPPVLGVGVFASISLLSGAVVTINRTITAPAARISTTVTLYDCDGTQVDQNQILSPSSTGSQTLTAPSDGEYIIQVGAISARSGGSPLTYAASITCDHVFTVNPVIALWDDSGTTRSLWACPKLLLPPLTEATGDWYASCADADAVLTDPLQVSNCVGYTDGGSGVDGFTATDGITSLTFNSTSSTSSGGSVGWWGGINAVGGQTLSFLISTDGGTYDGQANIYDDTGTLVESVDVSGGSGTSAALPYTGRYTVSIGIVFPPPGGTPFSTITGVITSSGAFSVNQIQARYDLGLDCAGLLNCGDTCP